MAHHPTKDVIRAIRPELDKALAEIAKTHGLKELRAGNGKYTDGGAFSIKIEGIIAGGLSKEESFYDRIASDFGLPPRGTHFTANGGVEYTIVGTNTTGSKIIVTRPGKEGRFLIPVSLVKRFAAAASKAGANAALTAATAAKAAA